MAVTPGSSVRSSWGVDGEPYPASRWLVLVAPGLTAAIVIGAVVALVVSWQVGTLVAVMLLGISFLLEVTAGSWAMRRSGAGAIASPRLSNIAAGLASTLGVAAPKILVLEHGGPNALVVAHHGAPTIVVTRTLVDDFTRTEIEAVLAHCLVRAAEGKLRYSATASRLGRWASAFAPHVGGPDDVHAAALTRYPPALAAAIAKADPRIDDRLGPLWFVWDGASHVPAERRETALLDL